MLRPHGKMRATTFWGAVACCFSTLCVCATAIIVTEMILSRSQPQGAPPPSVATPVPMAAPSPPAEPKASAAPAAPAPAAPVAVEGNLVKNGGFEKLGGEGASLFEGWGYWGRWENGNYTLESVQGHTGKYAARMSCVSPGRGGISQKLEGVKPGDKLKITFWAKADKAVGGRLFLNLEGTPGDGWSSMDIKPGTYDWQEFTKVVTCPPSTAPDYAIVIFFYNKTQGSFTIDDVAAVKLAP